MTAKNIFMFVLLAIAAIVAIKILFWAFHLLMGVATTLIVAAVVIGIIYVIYTMFSKKNTVYR